MKKFALAISALAIATTSVWAGAVEDREAVMKERGKIIGGLSKVAKGEAAFDAAAVLEQLKALEANAAKFDADKLWAAGSTGNTGDSPSSSPKIWEDMAGFKAAEEKYETAVKAAVAAAPADVAALGAAVGAIGKDGCAGCHETYRISKN
jgi:cytochrome c556